MIMTVEARLSFKDWLILDTLLYQNSDWGFYNDNLEIPCIHKFLEKRGIDWDSSLAGHSKDAAYEWLQRGYVPDLSPSEEARVLFEHWQKKYLEDYESGELDGIPKDANNGYIYVLRSGPYCKIGRTKNVLRRFPQISLQLPFETRLFAVFWEADMCAEEAGLHWFFNEQRQNGEWFILPEQELWDLRSQEPTTGGMYAHIKDEFE